MSGPERIWASQDGYLGRRWATEKHVNSTEYVRADLYEQAHQAETNAIRCMENACTDNERIKAQRDRYAEALREIVNNDKSRHWTITTARAALKDDGE